MLQTSENKHHQARGTQAILLSTTTESRHHSLTGQQAASRAMVLGDADLSDGIHKYAKE